MIDILSAILTTNLNITEHFPTFKITELTNMNVNYHSRRFRNII